VSAHVSPDLTTVAALRAQHPPAEGETEKAWLARLVGEKRLHLLERDRARDLTTYRAAAREAATAQVPLLLVEPDSAPDPEKTITIKRSVVRDVSAYRAFRELAERTGKQIVLVD
jgi:hypothetical protein